MGVYSSLVRKRSEDSALGQLTEKTPYGRQISADNHMTGATYSGGMIGPYGPIHVFSSVYP